MLLLRVLFCLLVFVKNINCLFDPVTLSVAAGLGALGWNYKFVKDQTICRFRECCTEQYIPANINLLRADLRDYLYGQHIVLQNLIPALQAHFSSRASSKKPLVISFHGTPGTGKNFVADFIAKALYKNGQKSKYVHKYLGRADFPLVAETHLYQKRITNDVRAAVAECPRSLFIFDEVEKMPPGVFESLTSLVNHNNFVNGDEFNKAIFVLLSNTAGVEISDKLGKLIQSGVLREETKLSDFEKILELASYNLEGGMKKTSLIEAHVIDHYLPFLPLEKVHVSKCLEAEYRRWGVSPNYEEIENLVKHTVSFEKNTGLFATSGCKTLEKKVAVLVKTRENNRLRLN